MLWSLSGPGTIVVGLRRGYLGLGYFRECLLEYLRGLFVGRRSFHTCQRGLRSFWSGGRSIL